MIKFKDEAVSFVEAASAYFLEGSHYNKIAMLSNLSAFIFSYLDDLNWAGFYLFDGKNLILGPFQGDVACTMISLNRGVCGKAAREKKSIIVDDVRTFVGHIACSDKSRSELVVPVLDSDNSLLGVIDLDSPYLNRFTDHERILLEALASEIAKRMKNEKAY